MGTHIGRAVSSTRSAWWTVLWVASAGCLVQGDVYDERRDELLENVTEPRVPDDPGVLVRVIDPFGRPADGLRVFLPDGTFAITDGTGLASFAGAEPTTVSVDAPGMAPTAVSVAPFDGYVGATLDLVPLGEHKLTAGAGTINEAGVRSVAFRPTALDAKGDVVVPYVWGDGRAPPSDAVDLLRAVYLGVPEDAVWIGPAVWRARAEPDLTEENDLGLYRFDVGSGEWEEVSDVDASGAWMVASLDAPGAWYAMGAPLSGCVKARLSGSLSGEVLPGAELRITRDARGGPTRAVTGADGTACLGGPGAVTLGVLRGVNGTAGGAWFDAGHAQVLALGQDLDLELTAAVDADGDGAPGAEGWDCDDSDPSMSPAIEGDPSDGKDSNCDGIEDGVDADQDGVPASEEAGCDDDPLRSPALEEACDDRDNDCDGFVDNAPDMPDAVEYVTGTCIACAAQTVAELNPIFYFPFDEVDEHSADFSGWGRDLTLTGAFDGQWPGIAHWDQGTPYWSGDIGEFLWLEDADHVWPANQLTVSVWIRPEYPNRSVLSYQSDRDEHVDEYVAGTCGAMPAEPCDEEKIDLHEFDLNTKLTRTVVQTSDLDVEFNGASALAAVRAWTHLVFVRGGQEDLARLFVNGQEVVPDLVKYPLDGLYTCATENKNVKNPMCPLDMVSGGVLRVGQGMFAYPQDGGDARDGDMRGVRSFEGVLDELAIFDRVLTDAEITTLYDATSCGEGVICNDDDDDGDGTIDEHLLGTPACPAEGESACADIIATQSEMDVGPYTVVLGLKTEPFEAWCDGDQLSYCGDGLLSNLVAVPAQESCDPGDSASKEALGGIECDECVAEMTDHVDCDDILTDFPSARDGVYRVDFDGDGPHGAVSVRCDMDAGEGWTQVFRHDTRAGVLWNDPSDATGLCPAAIEDCDDPGDCGDPECVTFEACAADGPTPSPWRPENLLCPDPRDLEIVEAYCGCACPSRTSGDNTACIGPLGAKFSVVDYLDDFQNASGQVQYRLRWPFHEASQGAVPVTWCQDWLPYNDPLVERGHDRSEGWAFSPDPGLPTRAGFAGLAPHGVDKECDEALVDYQFAAFDGIAEQDYECSTLFAVGLNRGNGEQETYGIPSNDDHFPDGTSKTVELWARRVIDGGGQCP